MNFDNSDGERARKAQFRNAELITADASMTTTPVGAAFLLWRETSLYRTAAGALVLVRQDRSDAKGQDEPGEIYVGATIDDLVEGLMDSVHGITELDVGLLAQAGYEVRLEQEP